MLTLMLVGEFLCIGAIGQLSNPCFLHLAL
jgi:hypothetical protein